MVRYGTWSLWDSLTVYPSHSSQQREGTECDRCVIVAFSAKLCWSILGARDKADIRKRTLQPQSYLMYHVVGPHQGSQKCVQALMEEGPGSGQEAEYASLEVITEWRRRRKTSWSTARAMCSLISSYTHILGTNLYLEFYFYAVGNGVLLHNIYLTALVTDYFSDHGFTYWHAMSS